MARCFDQQVKPWRLSSHTAIAADPRDPHHDVGLTRARETREAGVEERLKVKMSLLPGPVMTPPESTNHLWGRGRPRDRDTEWSDADGVSSDEGVQPPDQPLIRSGFICFAPVSFALMGSRGSNYSRNSRGRRTSLRP